MSDKKLKIKIMKNKDGKMDVVLESKKNEMIENDEKDKLNEKGVEKMETDEKDDLDAEKKDDGNWIDPVTDSDSEGESSGSGSGSESEGTEKEEDQLLNESDEGDSKNETLKESLAKKRMKRKEREEKEELKRMMAEMKKMKKEMDEEREKLNEEKKDLQKRKEERKNENRSENENRMSGQWVQNRRMRVDKRGLKNGWVWASEGKNWVDGIFGFLDEDGKRLIGMEYNLIMDGGSQKVKGVWNCILKKDDDGKILYDGGMMDEKCKGFLEGGENAHCCQIESKRGIYKMRRMGKVWGTKGEQIYYFKWTPINDTNIGLGVGQKPHLDCRGGELIVD